MGDGKARRFDRAFKLAALARMAAGENVSALSRELGAQRKLLYQASHDALTSLVNRTEFESCLRKIVSDRRRTRRPHAVCCMDLDQFKLVNDTCGHGAGDELLRRLSGMMQSQVRTGDVLARLGGDEFGILLDDLTGPEQAEIISTRLLECLGDPFDTIDGQVRVRVSIGVAFNDDPDTDAVIMIGEIGGPDEAEAARWCKANMKKPIVGFIAGVTAPAGKRMGHAGALISGGADTADAKLAIMEECGFIVTRNPSELGKLLKAQL